MAAKFYLGPQGPDDLCTVFVRVQAKNPKVSIRLATGIKMAEKVFNSPAGSLNRQKFCKDPDIAKAFAMMEEINQQVYAKLDKGVAMKSQDLRELIDDVRLSDIRAAEAQKEEEEKRRKAEEKKMTLSKYIEQYLKEIKAGARQTDSGKCYSPETIRTIVTSVNQWKAFQKKKHKVYDFDDVDMKCYYDFTTFLKTKTKKKGDEEVFAGYSINTVGKCIKQLKAILNAAETEGYHHNAIYKNKKFKGTRVEVDNVYLTKEELQKLMDLKFEKPGTGMEIARDIFMVGCWTAQRVSDYNNISKDSIQTLVKRSIEDVPNPDKPGETMEVIKKKEITYISIRQQKTGAKVAIPCSTQLLEILKKYDFQMPHLEDQVINRYLKDLCKAAGIDDMVEIEETKGGTPKKVWKPKYDLVHTHTARRTGATLMYLSGMDVYDIMKITGHSSPVMLKKYIKADQLTVVEKITDKYDYFD